MSRRRSISYLDSGKAFVAISIPKDFSERMRTGKETPLQIIVDGSDSNTATIALGYMSAITERFSQTDQWSPHNAAYRSEGAGLV